MVCAKRLLPGKQMIEVPSCQPASANQLFRIPAETLLADDSLEIRHPSADGFGSIPPCPLEVPETCWRSVDFQHSHLDIFPHGLYRLREFRPEIRAVQLGIGRLESRPRRELVRRQLFNSATCNLHDAPRCSGVSRGRARAHPIETPTAKRTSAGKKYSICYGNCFRGY